MTISKLKCNKEYVIDTMEQISTMGLTITPTHKLDLLKKSVINDYILLHVLVH